MPWVRLDDHFDENPKILSVGPLGMALWVSGLAYCNRNLTDGFIPTAIALRMLCLEFVEPLGEDATVLVGGACSEDDQQIGFVPRRYYVPNLLVSAGLWERVTGGYRVHDYATYQPTREEVEAEREQKRAAGRAGGIAAAKARAQAEGKQTDSTAQAEGQAEGQAESKPVPVPVPTASNEAEDDAPASGRTPRPRKRNIQESDIARWQDEHPEWDIPAFVADYLNWSGSSRHSDKVQGFENQMRIEWKCKQFTRAGAGPPPRVITFDDDLPLPEGMALPEVRFQR